MESNWGWLGLTAQNRPGRFSVLLLAILTLLIVQPLVAAHAIAQTLLTMMLAFVLLSAVYAFRSSRAYFWIATTLMVPTFVMRFAVVFAPSATVEFIAALLSALFLLVTVVALVSRLFSIRSVSLDTISAAICAYLLMGISWGFLYAAVELAHPQSFSAALLQTGNGATAPEIASLHIFIYYSFVTLTTTGYGDILPLSQVARILSMLEAVFGTLYIAILISRLVSLELAQSMMKDR
ncbi:MAG TPA: ion channel [Candidatus Acidoferrales bacterium]|nr:ion channel [Candidatus Acidoferrales bacterium]